MKAETITFTKVVPIADCDGEPIHEGSVLREINDGERGVVVRIVRVGDRGTIMDQAGDLNIQTCRGTTRVSNRYDQWKHIPHDEQTYEERFISWLKRPYDHNSTLSQVSEDERKAIDGIMALLPEDAVNWDYGPFPDKITDALDFLVKHLAALKSHHDSAR